MVIPAFMVMETRHPHIQLRPPANAVSIKYFLFYTKTILLFLGPMDQHP